jgi:hypothetical protein
MCRRRDGGGSNLQEDRFTTCVTILTRLNRREKSLSPRMSLLISTTRFDPAGTFTGCRLKRQNISQFSTNITARVSLSQYCEIIRHF